MEETDTLQKYYSCFLLPRPRREHHCAERTLRLLAGESTEVRAQLQQPWVSWKMRGHWRNGFVSAKSHWERLSQEAECCCFPQGMEDFQQKGNLGMFHLAPGESCIGLEAVQAWRSVWECGSAIREFSSELCTHNTLSITCMFCY